MNANVRARFPANVREFSNNPPASIRSPSLFIDAFMILPPFAALLVGDDRAVKDREHVFGRTPEGEKGNARKHRRDVFGEHVGAKSTVPFGRAWRLR